MYSAKSFIYLSVLLTAISVAFSQSLPSYDHVVVVVMENHSYQEVRDSGQPFINNYLRAGGANMVKSYGLQHPSQPNYYWLFSGANQGIVSDAAPSAPTYTTPNLYTSLAQAGKSFGGYINGYPGAQNLYANGGYSDVPGNIGSATGNNQTITYATKHMPWLGFQNVPMSVSKDFETFGTTAADFKKLPSLSFVIPALENDFHNYAWFASVKNEEQSAIAIENADQWLEKNLKAYAEWAKKNNSLLILTTDEDSTADWITPPLTEENYRGASPEALTSPDAGPSATGLSPTENGMAQSGPNQITTILFGAGIASGNYSQAITHVNLLRTIEGIFGLQPIGQQSSAVTTIGENPIRWNLSINDSPITINGNMTADYVAVENSTLTVNGRLDVQSANVSGGQWIINGIASSGVTTIQGGQMNVNGMMTSSTTQLNGGKLIVNGIYNSSSEFIIGSQGTLGGSGVIRGNVANSGTLAPGNSPGTLTITGNYVQASTGSLNIEIASLTNFDRLNVSGTATLGGALNFIPYGGNALSYGEQYNILQAESIMGNFATITAPETLRGRFLNGGGVGTILIAPDTYTRVAVTPNQRQVAKALDSFIPATIGDRELVSIALDLQTAEQFPAAFDQIMPGFYESLVNISIEQAFNQTQMLNQRTSSVRLGAAGFQAMGGISQPLLYDKDGKSAADAKDASPIVESAMATNWNSWALGNGQFSRTTNLSNLLNSKTDAGGFLVGADYRWSENFVSGLYAGYEYTYSKYGSDSNMRGNSVNFGGYASYATEEGYYADAVVGGGYTGYQTRRSIQFSTIDRTAQADPNATQFSAALNLGKDFEISKFTLGPIVGAQYTYAGIGRFTETGAESLDLALVQQNANSLRSTLGGRIAYTWNLNKNITLIPEVRMFWQHEFLNNARNNGAALDGGNGESFDFKTTDPYRDSVFAGAGVTAQFGKNLSGSVFYNVNFGSQTYQSNMVSVGLNFGF